MKRTLHKSSRYRGLSLVEVLASLVLVAVVLPVAMHCIALAMNASAQAGRRIEATTLAQSKLSELIAQRDDLGGTQQGDFGEIWPQYRWSATTASFDDRVNTLQLTITWPGRHGDQSLTFTTLTYTER